MVAGVAFHGHQRIIERCLNVGDRVRLAPEPDNPHDDCAVAVTLANGRKIGYVPRTDSQDVSGCIDDGQCYVATVKKILRGGHRPVPVIVVQFYRPDQLSDIVDLKPDTCPTASTGRSSPGCLRSLSSLLALPFLPIILAVRLGVGLFTLITKVLGAGIIRITALGPHDGIGAAEFPKRSMRAVTNVAVVLGSRLGQGTYFAALHGVTWLASVKDDFQGGDKEREVKAAPFIGKLLVIVALSTVLIIVLIRLALAVV